MTGILFVVSTLFGYYIHLKFVLYQLVALKNSCPISQHGIKPLRPEREVTEQLKEGNETDSFYIRVSEGSEKIVTKPIKTHFLKSLIMREST